MITLKTTTFGCVCGYHQDFSPQDDPDRHNRLFPGVPIGVCPSCATNPNPELRTTKNRMGVVLEMADMSTHETLETEEIDDLKEIERDEEGNIVKVASGEVSYKFNQETGKVEEVPIMVEKMRELTKQEKSDKLDYADKMLNKISKNSYVPGSTLPIIPDQEPTMPSFFAGIYKVREVMGRAGMAEDVDLSSVALLSSAGLMDFLDDGTLVDIPPGLLTIVVKDEEVASFMILGI